ncbi:hypothetical protein [Piscicoccus intestinalis]|uniref:hypothetical protein n=1 Tax=Piscicoccus intestinalis TaxID=746033 RepID=UPI0008387148|nr:hypothetical protein [Piscicoccus intestinalis]
MSETSCCSNPTPSTSDRIAARLDRLPRLATAGVVMALVVVGLAIGGPIGVLPAVLGILGLAFILAVTWRRITVGERYLRVAVVVLLIGLTLVRAFPQ